MKNPSLTHARLQSDLRKFGLNPSDWTLLRIQALTYQLQNRFDKTFTLQGQLHFKKQKPQWKSLELVSL